MGDVDRCSVASLFPVWRGWYGTSWEHLRDNTTVFWKSVYDWSFRTEWADRNDVVNNGLRMGALGFCVYCVALGFELDRPRRKRAAGWKHSWEYRAEPGPASEKMSDRPGR